MTDDLQSGPWTGFYTYNGLQDKHRMDLVLTFNNGVITGEGNDDLGAFVISGHYDNASKECHWTKSYVGLPDVFYRGCAEGKGIWGTWEIGDGTTGGFHIWPLGSEGDGEVVKETEEEPIEEVNEPVLVVTQ